MLKRNKTFFDRFVQKVKNIFRLRRPEAPYMFFYKKETKPPVSVKKVLSKIKKPYDLIMVYFWQDLLSFYTLESIFEKLNKPVVFFLSPDYSHMSGGCHFTADCQRYKIGCGHCPAWKSRCNKDFTHWNVMYRKRFYDKVKPVVFGNSYMISFYKSSFLLKDARIEKSVPMLDTDLFSPIERVSLLKKYDIPSNIRFIIGFGCQQLNNPRKGINYLIEALNILRNSLSESVANEILIISVGDFYETIKPKIPFLSLGLGVIPVSKLSEFYSLVDIFVCPSVDDAGPSMVLQSISCGTPVVGFEMGALLDHVKDQNTGYCARLKDSMDLANGIRYYYEMTDAERYVISKRCRENVLRQYSFSKKIQNWMDVYKKYAF